MYLHSVMAKEVLQNRGVSRADAEASERSGSTDSGDTANILRALPNFARFEALAERFRAIGTETQQILLREGILSQEAVTAMNTAYQHYVPLKGGPLPKAIRPAKSISIF